ncbi:MAG: sensor histidine kinase [Clostridia bacterium]|nr:sensor histidine kinase [Clostridia bacterium]
MRRKEKTWSLKFSILISCVGCMVLALLLQLLLFMASSSSVISAQTAQINQRTLENLSDDIYDRLKRIENSLITVYEHKSFVRELAGLQDADALSQQYGALAYEMAGNAFDSDENLVAFYIYTMDHGLISSYRHAQTPIYTYPVDIYDYSMKGSSEGVQEIIASNPTVMTVTSYYNDKRQLRLVRCVLRILENAKTPIGYMVCDVDPKGFESLMRKYRYSDEQAVWLQPQGRMNICAVIPENEETMSVHDSLAQRIQEAKTPAASQKNHELYSASVRKYGIDLYSLIPASALNANQTMLLNSTVFAFVLVLVLFAVLFFFVSRGLTRPLDQMADTMNRIKQGEVELRLPEMHQDELKKLGSTFNDMLDQIEELIASEYQTMLQLNDTKYKALQTQVNPHFLYNTLDTMSAIAMINGCEIVSTLCHALSDLFRYSLRMDEPLAPISEELKHLKNYMYVMNVRMNNSVELSIDIPADMMKTCVPRLSLQPLVENAISHGLKNKRGDKRIAIRAWRTQDEILLAIEDNGVGMSEEMLERVRAIDPEQALSSGTSIGLLNIAARLKLLFGRTYGLEVESDAQTGTKVTLHIPSDQEANADE